MLWVLAFWTGIPKAVYSIIKPSPVDYIQDRFGVHHHSKRGRNFKAGGLLDLKINPGKGLGWAAFAASELSDKIGWYLLIADVTAELILNWTSTAYQWNGCQVPGSPWASGSQTVSHPQAANSWQLTGVGPDSAHIFSIGFGGIITIPPGYDYSCGGNLVGSVQPPLYKAHLVATRILDSSSGKVLDEWDSFQFDDTTWQSSLHSVGRHSANGAQLIFQCRFEDGDDGLSTAGNFWASGAQGHYLLPDP